MPPSQRKPMTNSLRSLFHTLGKLLALPWRLATYQLQPPDGRLQGGLGPTEEDVELGLYLLR